jgi:hypothetical protein
MSKKKYVVKKVAEGGEDVTVDGRKFDALLRTLLKSTPIPQKTVRVRVKKEG